MLRWSSTFEGLIALAAQKRDLSVKAALERDVRLVRCEDGRLDVALEPSAAKTLVNDLSSKFSQWTGRRWVVVVSARAGAADGEAVLDARQAELKTGVRADPLVQAVLARFPGAKIVDVRAPDQIAAAGRRPPTNLPDDLPPRRRAIPMVRTGYATTTGRLARSAMADFLGLMKQAAELKSKMEAMQAELEPSEVEGSPAAAWSREAQRQGRPQGRADRRTLIKPAEKEILEDLIVAAHADARRKVETLMKDKMQSVAGGLPLPPGMKLF